MATVISTEEAIDLLAPHRRVSKVIIRDLVKLLKTQGLIEPICAVGHVIDNSHDPYDVARVYAAVELGWETVLVDFEGKESG